MKPFPQQEEKKNHCESMKTTSIAPDVATKFRQAIARQTIDKMIKKKKLFVKYLPSPMSTERRPPMMMNYMSEVLSGRSLSRPPCIVRTHIRNKVPPYDPTLSLPRTYVIMHCERCQSYSHTGRDQWLKLPSTSMLQEFLVNRIKFHIQRLRLKLLDSWIVHLDSGHDNKSTIMLNLKLQFQAPSGDWHEKFCAIEFRIVNQICSDCACLIDESQLSSVVQLRQYASQSHHRILRSLEISIRRNPQAGFNIQKIKYAEHGVDFFFNNDRDAMALSHYLTTLAPVKCNQMRKNIQCCAGSSYNGSSLNAQNVITVVVCPILPHDLVYLPQMVSATLGLQHMGPLVVCLNMNMVISLIDPLNLKHCVIKGNDYWKNPFESVKSGSDLVEYIVVGVNIVSREGTSFADVQVVRDSDFGKNNVTMLARTHLGLVLKPGDRAYGYDLHGLNITGVDIENIKHMLPDVVLVRKKWLATNQPQPHRLTRKKKKSPEYEQFLRDLESNPEALFNLSLNGGDGEKQDSEVSSEKPENVGLELEDLLADLALNDQEKRDTTEKQ